MTEKTHRLSRRKLLQLGAAGAAAVPLSSLVSAVVTAQSETGSGRSVSRTTGSLQTAIPTICHGCDARCGMLGYAEDTVLMKLGGNPSDPNSLGALCARGHAAMNALRDPDRLTSPLRREGNRRDGKWVQVSWDEALGELAERIRRRTRPDSLVVHTGTLAQRSLVARFAAACGTPHLQIDEMFYQGSRRAASQAVVGTTAGEVDVRNAKFVLNFGANPYENHPAFVPFVRRLIEARLNGARVVTFDPRLSQTAGRSDTWFPLRPGTDGAVAMAMARIIVERGLHDTAFLERYTDLTQGALTEMLAGYSPEAVARQADLDLDDLEQTAVAFATTKPACAFSGGGVAKRPNGVAASTAVALLNVLTGNVGVAGGIYRPPVFPLAEIEPVPPPVAAGAVPGVEPGGGDLLGEMASGRLQAEILMVHKANPAYTYPKSAGVRDLLVDQERLPFVVCYDTYLTETAELADLVLPAATFLESWDLDSPPALDGSPYVLIGQPLARSTPPAVDAPELYSDLAKRVNGGAEQYFPFSSGEEYVSRLVAGLPAQQPDRIFAELRSRGVWMAPAQEAPYRFLDQASTASARPIELSPAALAKKGLNIASLGVEQPLAEGEFHFVPYQTNLHYRGQTGASKWLNEIVNENPAWVNADVARERGWHDGDKVQITSAAGSLETRIRLSNGIRPDTLVMADGVGHWAVSRVARAVRFNSDDPDTRLVWWGARGNGNAPSQLLEAGGDASGPGRSWLNTRVKVEKV